MKKFIQTLYLVEEARELCRNRNERMFRELSNSAQVIVQTLSELYQKDSFTLTDEEKRIAALGKIECIKNVRQRTNLTLKESKDLVDNYRQSIGLE
jgi:ribosomal protein L7/L12